MKFRTILFDIIFLLALTALMIVFNEAGKLEAVMKYPLVICYGSYLIGRYAGVLSVKKK